MAGRQGSQVRGNNTKTGPYPTRDGVGGKVVAGVVDVACIGVFVALGLSAHGHRESVNNLLSVAGPFLVGALVGWLISSAYRGPFRPLRVGVPVALSCVIIGQILRVILGQGTAIAFIAVSASFLGAFLVGWRALYLLIGKTLMSRNP